MKIDFSVLRKKMVEEQLIPREIEDPRLLEAFQKVPRHKFVPQTDLANAYGDFPLSIGSGQTISQPYMVALMTQQLELSRKKIILEIGTGSGYQTAILAELAGMVYSIERISGLAEKAKQCLKELDYRNVAIKVGDGTLGWPEFSPYDGIIVTAAAPSVPQNLIEQLKVGGKLVIPIGETFTQVLTLITKHRNEIKTSEICGCVFVPLIGEYGWKK